MSSHEQYFGDEPSPAGADFRPSNLVDMLRFRALNGGGRHGYTFLNDGQKLGASFTYSELDERARGIAALLQASNLERERALLIYPAGLDFVAAFFGCLYAGVIAVPFPAANPAQPARSLPKLQAVAADARPAIVLTVSRLSAKLREVTSDVSELNGIPWLETGEVTAEEGGEWQSPLLRGDTLAYLQYTSGSTAQPKGVMVTHSNVLYGLEDIDQAFLHDSDSVIVSWLPHYHDLGLVYGILEPLYKGISCYLMAPTAFVQRPIRWLEAISTYKGTHSAAPNFAYDLCVRRITAEQL
ncbi:MAG TPA: AMP-binding protein, partial [Blastocatellia bacterium]|nr:AMP-binding protein [Blastocatellia bacterium]